MLTILLIILIVAALGGGGYWWNNRFPPPNTPVQPGDSYSGAPFGGLNILWVVILIILLFAVLGHNHLSF